jgi:protein-L-isoaspartate(D-aspartate) O-methyltransferase
MVATMLEVLDPRPDHHVLEIGAGSGYQAALLAELSDEVRAVEIVEDLAKRARERLLDLGYDNVDIVIGDGTQGLPEHAPYDRIIVAAGAPRVPEPLVEQLADVGRLVIPIGGRVSQRLVVFDREGDEVHRSERMSCAFVPLVGRHGWRPGP